MLFCECSKLTENICFYFYHVPTPISRMGKKHTKRPTQKAPKDGSGNCNSKSANNFVSTNIDPPLQLENIHTQPQDDRMETPWPSDKELKDDPTISTGKMGGCICPADDF